MSARAAAVAVAAALLWAWAGAAQQQIPEIRIEREVGAARRMALETGQNRLIVVSEQIGRIAVANPDVADLKVITPTQVLLTAKTAGTTDLTLWNRDNAPLVIALEVVRSLEGLRKQLVELFPREQVSVSAAGDLLVLSGEVSDVRLPERIAEVARLHAPRVANLVKVSGDQQVQLEVRFAEVARAGMRDLGVNFFHRASNGSRVGGLFSSRTSPWDYLNTPQRNVPWTGSAGLAGVGLPPDVPAPSFQDAFSLFLSENGPFPFSVMLNLLEQNNLAKVLAEPTLVAMSGQEARFLAGGELPIPLASSFGQTSVEWKKFGIQLQFTPTVIGDAIHLKVRSEVSDIDPSTGVAIGGTTIPGLSTRQSETAVRLGDGQSFAIAGLLSDRVRQQTARVPVLGSIPILGALFRSTAYRRDESELIVVVTARLARPLAPHELPPLPTEFESNDPGDAALFLLGSEGGRAAVHPAAPPGAGTRGPAGHHGFAR